MRLTANFRSRAPRKRDTERATDFGSGSPRKLRRCPAVPCSRGGHHFLIICDGRGFSPKKGYPAHLQELRIMIGLVAHFISRGPEITRSLLSRGLRTPRDLASEVSRDLTEKYKGFEEGFFRDVERRAEVELEVART